APGGGAAAPGRAAPRPPRGPPAPPLHGGRPTAVPRWFWRRWVCSWLRKRLWRRSVRRRRIQRVPAPGLTTWYRERGQYGDPNGTRCMAEETVDRARDHARTDHLHRLATALGTQG